MKKISVLLLAIFIGFSSNSFAQKDEYVPTCYQKYEKVFEERGASEVKDGTYDDIIISIRYRSQADCFLGKVRVVGGSVDVNSIMIKFEDGTYEEFKKIYKEAGINSTSIINGISKTLVTMEDELINVLFVQNIKKKKQPYKKAPEPSFDF